MMVKRDSTFDGVLLVALPAGHPKARCLSSLWLSKQ